MSNYERVRKWAPTTIASIVLAGLAVWGRIDTQAARRKAVDDELNSLKGRVVTLEKEADEQRVWRRDNDEEQRRWFVRLEAVERDTGADRAAAVQWTRSVDARLTELSRDFRDLRRQLNMRQIPDEEGFGGGALP